MKILLPALLCALSLSFQACSQDPVQATKSKAERGDAVAQYNLGVKYANGQGVAKDEAAAVKWWRKAAEQGCADAQTALGYMYDFGRGVAKDEVAAVKWYRKAAEQGHAKAQFFLGCSYSDGDGVAKDEDEGVRLYTLAAHQGYTPAQYCLARVYHIGAMRAARINMDGAKLRVTAYQYFLIARANGEKDGEKEIKELEGKLTPAQKDEAMKFVREFKPVKADKDHLW